MFGRSKDVPKQVNAAGLTKWYSSLDDQNKAKLNRYLENADTTSDVLFFNSVTELALNDENYVFAAFVGSEGAKLKMKDMQRFVFNENLIQAYVESERTTMRNESVWRAFPSIPRYLKNTSKRTTACPRRCTAATA